jgi:serine phosphatase RsbU (regulator of sigma subunit)
VWDPPAGAEATVGGRHVVTLLLTVVIGVLVSGLGTVSFPVGDTPSGFAPGAAIQVVAGVWFGGWGILAGVIFPAIVRTLTGPDNVAGRVLADLILCGLPAWWFRYSRRDPRLPARRDRIMFLLVVVGLANVLAAVVGTTYLALVRTNGAQRWLPHVLAWFAAGAGPCLVLGLPLLRTLSPVVVRSSLFCRAWWQSPARPGPHWKRFRHQPIMIKIMLGLAAAGFVPLVFIVAVNLWDDFREARVQAMATQRKLADEIEREFVQLLANHEELVARWAAQPAVTAPPESLRERSSAPALLPSLFADVRYAQLSSLEGAERFDNEQMAVLESGRTLIDVGPGPPPERRRAINLLRLVRGNGFAAGTVVVDSINLADVEKNLFLGTRQLRHEFGLFAAGRPVLMSEGFRRPAEPERSGEFTETAGGRRLLYHRRTIEPPGWQLELMIPQAFGVKDALAERRNYTAVPTTLALFAALMFGGYLARALEQPIRSLTRTMRESGRLDMEVEAEVYGHDEIGELAATFNEMSRQLRRSISALERTTAEKERLAYEFEVAAALQGRILPTKPPVVPGFEIAGVCVPAREVGGDFYDWHMLSDIRLGLLVGDACGKGLAAAFLVNEARSVALAHLQDTASAGAVLRRTNYTLVEGRNEAGMFTTMFCAILSVPSRRLDFASAGHPAPIWYRHSAGELESLDTDGRPLGLELENPIGQGEAYLEPGDVIVAFTDGVLDAANAANERFGRDRLEQLVREFHAEPAAELARRIQDCILEFSGGTAQFDDLTLLVLKSIAFAESDESAPPREPNEPAAPST